MGAKKPKVVIIGAGMAGLTAAQKLFTTQSSRELFDLSLVEGGSRIGGRINTSEFCGDRIEMGATWIHGIQGSPVYKIAQETNSLQSDKPWECMDGFSDEKISSPTTIAEGGLVLNPSIVELVSSMFDNLMRTAQTKEKEGARDERGEDGCVVHRGNNGVDGGEKGKQYSIGSFLRQGLEEYWESTKGNQGEETAGSCVDGGENWSRRSIEEAIFALHENVQRTYTGAGDLFNLDYKAESEYEMFPGEEITIPKGYTSVIDSLASYLPSGLIQLGKKVVKIEWNPQNQRLGIIEDGEALEQSHSPVNLHFSDGSSMEADHVIVTVSLGVLKAGVREGSSLFSPPLPRVKRDAIAKLGYGVVNKLFLEVSYAQDQEITGKKQTHDNGNTGGSFPFMQMAFHRANSEFRQKKIPCWMRRTASLYPIYTNSRVVLSWFAGKEALELESLDDEAIMEGVSTTVSSFSTSHQHAEEQARNHSEPQLYFCNGDSGLSSSSSSAGFKFTRMLKSKWGRDPLFLGSYSYVAVGSSGDDLDTMARPLPGGGDAGLGGSPLQILFAGEATDRTHYSTTHGAYLSGIREADRLLQHYGLL